MILWLDAQLSPKLVPMLKKEFGLEAGHVKDLGLLRSKDSVIFEEARQAGAVLVTKDRDFVLLVELSGVPLHKSCGSRVVTPQTPGCGICSSSRYRLPWLLLAKGEAVVEISDAR